MILSKKDITIALSNDNVAYKKRFRRNRNNDKNRT